MPGPLDGVRILEFTEIIAGPYGGMLLSDMGADVIKVEPPWGEPWRFAQEFVPNESRNFISLNRGKRSLPLDLTKPEGLEIVYKLIPDMDVVIINARPDVPHNLGIDYETLSARNPRLIYCDNTAFGRKGPHSYRPGYDLIVQAMTGLMASEGKVLDGVPQQIQSTAIADYATGITIAWAICAALYHRERTGKGQMVETTLLASALGVQTGRFIQVAAVDDERRKDFLELLGRMRANGTPFDEIHRQYREKLSPRVGNIYYRTYQASDGVLAIACLSDRLRKRAADLLELDDIRFQPGYDPMSEEARIFGEKLVAEAEAVLLTKTVEEWLKLFDDVGVPAGPVRFVEELIDDEQVIANDLVVELEHSVAGPLKMVGPMLTMSDSPLEVKLASPALGEHTDDILTSLGLGEAEIQSLRDAGVTR
ncbi:MAG: CoA transferase [Chloroflexi bacterium]|nr:CoA transferase [Chloroflexota bacterium]